MIKRLLPFLLLLCLTAVPAAALDYTSLPVHPVNQANKKRFTPDIQRIAQRYRVESALVHAVISAESGYNPNAVSVDGAVGLMQLLPTTAAEYGVSDLHDPVANIDVGTRHLSRLLKKYKNISHALAAYNAGEGTMQRSRRQVTYLETRKYVVRVINFYLRYKNGS